MILNTLTDHEWIITYNSTFSLSSLLFGVTDTVRMNPGWGDPANNLLVRFDGLAPSGGGSQTTRLSIFTPPAWSSGYANTQAIYDAAYVRVAMSGAKLMVGTGCAATLSFTSLDFYVSINGAAESLVLSIGAKSYSFTYDARSNICHFDTQSFLNNSGVRFDCTTSTVAAAATTAAGVGVTVGPDGVGQSGYRYKVGSTWTYEAFLPDSSTTGGTCPCGASPPSIRGADGGHVVLQSINTFAITITDFGIQSCLCPAMPGVHVFFHNWQSNLSWLSTYVYCDVINSALAVGPTQTTVYTDCNGVETTVTSSATSSPTVSAGKRDVQNIVSSIACDQYVSGGPCEVGDVPVCPNRGVTATCTYEGFVLLEWTAAPPCSGGSALAYDVSNSLRHARASINLAGDLAVGIAANGPLAWIDVDQGPGAIALYRLRWSVLGVYRDGASKILGSFYCGTSSGPLLYAESNTEGKTFLSGTTIASGQTYWALDLIWTAPGLNEFYWLESSGILYRAILDCSLNLRMSRTATNLTGLDRFPIAARAALQGTSGQTRGIFYSVGGVLKFATSLGGTTYGTPITITSGNTYWALDFFWSGPGLISFYWLESDGTIYRALLDNTGNLLLGRTATNLTGLDQTPIACCGSIKGTGGQRIGLFYTIGGMATFKTALDGLNFS